MNKTIQCHLGIFNTEYKLIQHQDGSISVRVPFIRWQNNNGNLDFQTFKVPTNKKEDILLFFQKNQCGLPANNGIGWKTIEEVLFGYTQ